MTFDHRGITGYTGYVPSSEMIQPEVKDTTLHTGKVRARTSKRGTGGLVTDSSTLTESRAAYEMTPDMFPKDMAARASGAISPYNPFHDGKIATSKPFLAESTYRTEMLSGQAKTRRVLEAGTYVGSAVRPEATGQKHVLYETEAQEKQAETLRVAKVERAKVQIGGYEPTAPEPSAGERERLERDFKSIEQAASRASFDTSYRRSFGGRGFNLRSTIPLTAADLSLKASTREFFSGTPKAAQHVPGYCGFIASADANDVALRHSNKVYKPSTKQIHLSELRQFPRHPPGYLGYQPHAFVNQADRKRNLADTTSSRADAAGTGCFQPGALGTSISAKAAVEYSPSTVGVSNSLVSNFFTHAALTVSDNGVHNAEAYYKLLRPFEGRSTAIIKHVEHEQILSNLV